MKQIMDKNNRNIKNRIIERKEERLLKNLLLYWRIIILIQN